MIKATPMQQPLNHSDNYNNDQNNTHAAIAIVKTKNNIQ